MPPSPTPPPPHLSKSRFVAGWQCHRLLWWRVHEPDALELQPDRVLQDLFDQGRLVGEAARERFPGGVLIDVPRSELPRAVEETRQALESGAPSVFEASFSAGGTFVAVDILERREGGFRLVEVKSSSSPKDEHIPEVAVQVHVAESAGVPIRDAHVMHLNPDHRHPDQGDLLALTEVTESVRRLLPDIPGAIGRQRAMLTGPIPEVPVGPHCFEPRDCPFMGRCWPQGRDHIRRLHGIGAKRVIPYLRRGIQWIADLPANEKLNFTQRRQLKAIAEDRLIVEPTLAERLEPFTGRLGFLDFETVNRALPPWRGMKPWEQAAAQFSYHEQQPDGTYTHAEHLAEGPDDARPPLAEAMVRATQNADRVVMYTSFEKTRIRDLQQSVPELARELKELEEKLIDLAPAVRECVYHPDFGGSFSLKAILTPLVPDLTYDDLVIVDGRVASVEIARLLFVAGRIPPLERDRVRHDLLDYCRRDTWAMVRLLERLRELARPCEG